MPKWHVQVNHSDTASCVDENRIGARASECCHHGRSISHRSRRAPRVAFPTNAPSDSQAVSGKSPETGYTLIELMIIVTIIALLAALALPLYGSYTGTAQAAKLVHHYDQAVRESRQLLINDRTRVSFDRPSALPGTTAAWIDTLAGDQSTAPGGGPAFIASETGDPDHGAIGVVFDTTDSSVSLVRPAYQGLAATRALVTVEGVTFSSL